MKIAVIGTFVRDRIKPWRGDEVQSIGGMFFTLSYLANLVDSATEIAAIAFIGDDLKHEVTSKLAVYPNLRLDGLMELPRLNTQVRLTYTSHDQREETTTEPMPALGYSELQMALQADIIMVNLITGQDLDVTALAKLKKNATALVYVDFHSHALGISSDGRRFYRRPADWKSWVAAADILQMNEPEARTLAGISGTASLEQLTEFGLQMLEAGPSVCHLTLAERGSLLFYSIAGKPLVVQVAAPFAPQVLDMVGCGDAFQAAYVAKYLEGKSVVEATRFANRAAALNCTFVGSSGIQNIRQLLASNHATLS